MRYNYFGIVHANVVPVLCEGFPSQRKTLPCGGSDKNSQSCLQVPNVNSFFKAKLRGLAGMVQKVNPMIKALIRFFQQNAFQ